MRRVFILMAALLTVGLAGCAGSAPARVDCGGKLRPINPTVAGAKA